MLPLDMLDNWHKDYEVLERHYLYAEETPQAKQSVRIGRGGAYTDPKKKKYIRDLCEKFEDSMPNEVTISGLVRVRIVFCFPFPLAAKPPFTWTYLDKKTDLDNLCKPTLDSLKEILLNDDSQVVELQCRKIRWRQGKPGFIGIRVDEIRESR